MEKVLKSERKAIYFDCICGIICSILALIGIFVFTQQKGIMYPVNFTVGLIFLGIYTYYKAKNFDPDAVPKKKLRAPMVG
jgi:uncharacterized membrane protein YfcA